MTATMLLEANSFLYFYAAYDHPARNYNAPVDEHHHGQATVNDPEIAAKWRQEALTSGTDITAKMIDWCLNKLPYNPTPSFARESTLHGETNPDLIGSVADQLVVESDEDWDRPVIRPEPNGPFRLLGPFKKLNIKNVFTKQGLQVIVMQANIELTPERPEYHDGTCHLEGQMSFRPQESEWVGSKKSDFSWLGEIFEFNDYGTAVQTMGAPRQPGHRKVVALSFVNPNIKIIRIANVPCQLQDRWWESVITDCDINPESSSPDSNTATHDSGADSGNASSANLLSQLPVELHDYIVLEDVDLPLCLEDAKAIREELMEERKEYAT
ncbi:hypothetical protein CVT25_010582 [Psilocybe cyanescens]|uniref:DUF4246 domain-containing protein n=1 Tax=Psilocybe cyanescens TaxID=93625 RepID=A0A409WJB6_PSICY|nr:hypothetical protein CVT25_010582 [Psilocybe cyanescens]